MLKKIIVCLLIVSTLNAKDIILWDIHGVLLQRSLSQTAKTIFSYNMVYALAEFHWDMLKKILEIGILNLIHETSGETYINLAHQYNNKPLEKVIIDITNAQKEMPGIQKIVDELASMGIEQHIGSNIGQTPFKELIDPQKFPQFQQIFSNMNIDKSRVVEYDAPDLIRKPDTRFFTSYLQRNHLDPKKTHIIFIDDLKSNVDAADKVGLDGIVFKNPNQLREELIKRNIPVAPPAPQKIYCFQAYQHLFK